MTKEQFVKRLENWYGPYNGDQLKEVLSFLAGRKLRDRYLDQLYAAIVTKHQVKTPPNIAVISAAIAETDDRIEQGQIIMDHKRQIEDKSVLPRGESAERFGKILSDLTGGKSARR